MTDPNTLDARWETPEKDRMAVTLGGVTASNVQASHWLWRTVQERVDAGQLMIEAYDPALNPLFATNG